MLTEPSDLRQLLRRVGAGEDGRSRFRRRYTALFGTFVMLDPKGASSRYIGRT